MATDDELWPPFGPGAALRQGEGRYAGRRGQEAGRRGQQEDRWQRQQAQDRRRDQFDQRRAERGPHGRDRDRPGLSRDDIVAVAIGIADRYGSEALSMRKIAQELHAGAMSLYWHVASKEHLLELMLDTINGAVFVPEPTGDWRADLRAQACSTRAVLLRHPWMVDYFSARPPLGPKTLGLLERMLSILDGLDIDVATAIMVFQTVNTYVTGAVIREFQEIRTNREQNQLLAGDSDLRYKLEDWMARLARTGKFQHFVQMISDGIDPDADETREARFEFGLDCLLEGIAIKLAQS